MAPRSPPQKLVVRVRTRRAPPARTVLCITTVSRPTRRIPCLDAEDAHHDHGHYHAYSPLPIFIHFITRHSYFPYFALPSHHNPPHPILRSALLPPPRRLHFPGHSDVSTELPETSRCCAARPRRRHLDDVRRRTVDEHTLEHGAYGAACSRRCRTRHDTRPQVWLETSTSRETSFASPPARAFLFLRTHTVLSFVLPSRSPSQSRLAHAAADGDDHLVVVTCLAAAYVRADTLASWTFVSLSTSPPLGSAPAHPPRSPPVLPHYALPITLWCTSWRLITVIRTRLAFSSPSPHSSYSLASDSPRAPVQVRGACAPAT
ncbi:hypothetical protein L226DRAFT_16275 [Lentinus tigrinus ALCF2SS1-7]|uniref:uncharacterized protein n=1 Tax=Lentinus tigrinus ALCF2SS1-7 TaxID=1328758 RepID=UPI001165FCB6|nr:hypothetical protein L226DRAFT_16275 [Lentinus tigrinus ALCF2SS1-7]